MRRFLTGSFAVSSLAVIVLLAHHAPKQDCRQFHKGSFYQPVGNGDSIFIDRTDSTQIDMYPNGNAIKASIKWLNDCEYELSLTGLVEKGRDVPVPKELRGAKNRVKITETTDTYYAFDAERFDGVKFSDKMWVRKKAAQ